MHLIALNSPRQRQAAKDLIDKAPDGCTVEFRPARRSIDQNSRMWAMLSDISRAKPEGRRHTPETWKALFMHACGHTVQFESGIDDGAPFPTGFRSSKLTKAQMSDLMEFMAEYGARHGVWSGQ